jgi:hypothetical protein
MFVFIAVRSQHGRSAPAIAVAVLLCLEKSPRQYKEAKKNEGGQ